MKCAVKNCKNSNRKPCTISFFRFPTDPALLRKWINYCCRDGYFNYKTSVICMEHFVPDDFENKLEYEMGFTNKRFLKTGVVPSVKKPENEELYLERAKRIEKRENKRIVEALLKEYDAAPTSVKLEPDIESFEMENVCLETENACLGRENECLETENKCLKTENKHLETENEYLELADKSQPFEVVYMPNLADVESTLVIENENEDINCLKIELSRLRRENASLKEEIKRHEKQLHDLQEKSKANHLLDYNNEALQTRLDVIKYESKFLEKSLLVLFTKGQIAMLKAGIKGTAWTEEDIVKSLTLYATSAKLYKVLYRNNFPLPAVRILRLWSQKLQISCGLLQPVFKILSATTHMTERQKVCVLSFNGIKLRRAYCYDQTTDTILAPKRFAQIATIRGLMAPWSQPIFYDLDCTLNVGILKKLLCELKVCGFTVAAMVCDLEGEYGALLKELAVTAENPWFLFADEKVHVFPDILHLMQLLRNHFIAEGFAINGKLIGTDIIANLVELTTADSSIRNEISQAKLALANNQNHKLEQVTNLFSHTVAEAIKRVSSLSFLDDYNWNACYKLFKYTSNWFDLMNVKVARSDGKSSCHAYGLDLEKQNRILDDMSGIINEVITITSKSLLLFQKGIMQSNKALKELLPDMSLRYGCNFILTSHLHRDVFDVTYPQGDLHNLPDPVELKDSLRAYILGQNKDLYSHTAGVQADDTQNLETSRKSLTGKIFNTLRLQQPTNRAEEIALSDIACDSLENLAHYICEKLKDEGPGLATAETRPQSHSSDHHLRESGIVKPTLKTMEHLQQLHKVFEANNKYPLLETSGFIRHLMEQAQSIDCDNKIKQFYLKSRIYLQIRKQK